MKNLKMLFAGVMALAFSLTSCSSDDDNDNNMSGNLQARWNIDKTTVKSGTNGTQTFDYTNDEQGCPKDYLEFAANNVLNFVAYYHNASDVCQADTAAPGSYTRNGDMVTIQGPHFPGNYEVTRLTGSELRLVSETTVANVTTITTIFLKKASNQN